MPAISYFPVLLEKSLPSVNLCGCLCTSLSPWARASGDRLRVTARVLGSAHRGIQVIPCAPASSITIRARSPGSVRFLCCFSVSFFSAQQISLLVLRNLSELCHALQFHGALLQKQRHTLQAIRRGARSVRREPRSV